MIAKYLNIECSPSCERLLAFTYLTEPSSLLKIARRIEGASGLAAMELASAIQRLDPEHAQMLAEQTSGAISVRAMSSEVTR
jgi:hypothetical protein